jgi:long-chain acyl-CoA synthetase
MVALGARMNQHDPDKPAQVTDVVRPRFTEPLRRSSRFENIRALIQGQASKHAERSFLINEFDGREVSFAALDTQTNRVANLLARLGLKAGSRVAVLMGNSPEFLIACLGVIKAGCSVVPLSTDLKPEQVGFVLEDCEAELVFVDTEIRARATEVFAGRSAVVRGPRHDDDRVQAELPDSPGGPVHVDFEAALAAVGDDDPASPEPRWWDEAAILYTDTVDSEPRGAVIQHRQLMTSARWLGLWLGISETDRVFNPLPMYHAYSLCAGLFAPLAAGASLIVARKFNVSRVWRAVERHRATYLVAVPSVLGILADHERSAALRRRGGGSRPWPAANESPGALGETSNTEAREAGLARGHDISCLRRVLCSVAPLHAAVHKKFEMTFLVPVIEGYCLPETAGFCAINPDNGTRRIGSVGVPVGSKIAIEDRENPSSQLDDWSPQSLLRMSPAVFPTADVNEPGEICVWGENVLREYHRRPKHNPRAFAGGWLHTGDMGYMDGDGFVFVEGERRQEIVSSGTRIMPREVDEVLVGHQAVESVETQGVADAARGALVTTWVVFKPGTFPEGPENGRMPADETQAIRIRADLDAYAAGRLPPDKRPSEFRIVTRLPGDVPGRTRVLSVRQLQ